MHKDPIAQVREAYDQYLEASKHANHATAEASLKFSQWRSLSAELQVPVYARASV